VGSTPRVEPERSLEALLSGWARSRGMPNLITLTSLDATIMSTNLLVQTIEPDEPSVPAPQPSGKINAPSNARAPVVLTPTNRTVEQMASNPNDAESGMSL
jgi:hypothetical protein